MARERLEARRRKKAQGQLTDEALADKLTSDEEKEALDDAVREMEGQWFRVYMMCCYNNTDWWRGNK